MDFNIVTYHGYNYGATLQALALQNFLIKNGYSAEIYDYKKVLGGTSSSRNLKSKISRFVGRMTKSDQYIKERKLKFDDFHKKYFKLNETDNSLVFLAGSDQIWNATRIMDPTYFLQFVDEGKYRASYAASMGVNVIPEKNKEMFLKYINTFDSVSVREEGAKTCIEKEYSGNIEVNVDPTLLHDKNYYLKFAKPVSGLPNKFILAYILHIPNNINKLLKWLKKETGLPIVLIDTTGSLAYFVKNDIVLRDAGPAEFLWLFSKAEATVTTSFHGTVFSLIFEKEFYSVVNHSSPSRISNLAEKCSFSVLTDTQNNFERLNHTNWEYVHSIIKAEQEKSKKYLDAVYQNALNKKKKRLTGSVVQMIENCTGCAACKEICPTSAIEMIINNEGFYEPRINNDLCIDCGKCTNNCPLNKKEISPKIKSFYGWSKDQYTVFNSSSGGAFRTLSNSVLEENGVVVGAVYANNFKSVVFDNTENVSIEKMQKSKYVVSRSETIYKNIKSALSRGKKVYFCGTPCQCAGIESIFGKNNNNLITSDFVCGGFPSLKFYREHIDLLTQTNNSEIESIDFRPKKWGWGRYRIWVKFKNGKNYIKRDFEDTYFCCFVQKKVSVRSVCKECPYRHYHRSDITIADYWGYKNAGQKKHKEGMSMLVANTEKGLNLIKKMKNFELFEIDEKNTRYAFIQKTPTKEKMDERNRFFELAQKNGFENTAKSLYSFSKTKRYFYRVMKIFK